LSHINISYETNIVHFTFLSIDHLIYESYNKIKESAYQMFKPDKSYINYTLKVLGLSKASKPINDLLKSNSCVVNDFKKSFIQKASISLESAKIFVESYKAKNLKVIKISESSVDTSTPILMCATKDDFNKVEKQILYHRKLGFKHFAYIDNNSTDGTYEWLLEQDDVSVFSISEKYIGTRRNSWRKQAMDFFGYDRWYLILDSDEFFAYPGMEQVTIEKYIGFLEKNRIYSALTPMIDMYTKDSLFSGTMEQFDLDYCYFDTDTYIEKSRHTGTEIFGGPRQRLFPNEDTSIANLLTKYALVKPAKAYICDTHRNYPLKSNRQCKKAVAFLLHYKFLPDDIIKYEEIIKIGHYSGGSGQYKHYKSIYENTPNLSFYYKKSQKMNSSLDLLKINIINKPFYDKFLKYFSDS